MSIYRVISNGANYALVKDGISDQAWNAGFRTVAEIHTKVCPKYWFDKDGTEVFLLTELELSEILGTDLVDRFISTNQYKDDSLYSKTTIPQRPLIY